MMRGISGQQVMKFCFEGFECEVWCWGWLAKVASCVNSACMTTTMCMFLGKKTVKSIFLYLIVFGKILKSEKKNLDLFFKILLEMLLLGNR